MFSGWLKKEAGIEEAVGLEAAKQKILGESLDPNDPRLLALKRANPDRVIKPQAQTSTPEPETPVLDSVREQELQNTTVTQKESESGRIPGHELGSSMKTAQDLNRIVEDRQSLMKKYEDDIKNLDLQEGQVNDGVLQKRQMIDDLLSSINQGSNMDQLRDRFIALAARASTYPKKVRAGKGARSIISDDREALLQPENLQRLRDGYGDGSWEQIKTLSDSMKILKEAMEDGDWDEVAKKWYNSQSSDIQSVFKGAGGLGSKDGGDGMHFAGFDEGGKKIPGVAGNMARTLALAKVFLQQGGLDGFTGRPLEFQHMEPDHIRGFSQKVNGKAPSREDRMMADHPDNWIWTATGLNNIKSNDALPDFLEKLQGMSQKQIDSLMSNDTLNLQDEGQRYLVDDTTDFARSFVTPYEDEGGSVNILSDALTQGIIDQRQGQQDGMIKSLQDMGAKVDESRLLTDIFAAGGQVPKANRLNLSSQNKSDVRERSQTRIGDNAMREMYRIMVGKPPQEQAKIARAWKQSWEESIQDIRDLFGKYDEAQNDGSLDTVDYGRDDLIMGENPAFKDGKSIIPEIMKGGPMLRKLFGLKMAKLLGKDGEAIRNKIKVNEMFSELDLQILLS